MLLSVSGEVPITWKYSMIKYMRERGGLENARMELMDLYGKF